MPRFGICGPLTIAAPAAAAGWDFIEGSVQAIFQGEVPDEQWTMREQLAQLRTIGIRMEAANMLLPGDLKPVGPSVDQARIDTYLSRVFRRAGECGFKTLVFGSGVARMVPEGFDRARASEQIVAFAKRAGAEAAKAGVTLVFEPLNKGECNIINSVKEGAEFTRATDHPNVKCLVDSYHFWLEKEPLANLKAAMPLIAHVHVADEHGREAPGYSSIPSDYRSFFRVLRDGGYDGRISVEGKIDPSQFSQTLAFLKREWADS